MEQEKVMFRIFVLLAILIIYTVNSYQPNVFFTFVNKSFHHKEFIILSYELNFYENLQIPLNLNRKFNIYLNIYILTDTNRIDNMKIKFVQKVIKANNLYKTTKTLRMSHDNYTHENFFNFDITKSIWAYLDCNETTVRLFGILYISNMTNFKDSKIHENDPANFNTFNGYFTICSTIIENVEKSCKNDLDNCESNKMIRKLAMIVLFVIVIMILILGVALNILIK